MVTIGKIEFLFLIVLLFVIVDTVIGDIFLDFSLVELGVNLAFLLGSLATWVGIFFQRLVSLDIETPFMYLIRILFAVVGVMGESVGDLLFDILEFIFGSIGIGAAAVGLPIPMVLDIIPGVYASIDFSTFTIRVGLILDFLGSGIIGETQISIFGSDPLAPANTRFSFMGLGLFGIEANLKILFIGGTEKIGGFISVEGIISDAFQAFFSLNGSLESLYQELIDELK